MSIHSTGLSDHEVAGSARGAVKGRAPRTAVVTPQYATIADWITISGIRRTATYELLGAGHLRAVKRGKQTLIDVPHGLAYLASLPVALITTGRRRDAANAACGCKAAS
jgi:hypothetical protein